MEIGMITPPVGLNLYVTSGVARIGLTDTSRAVLPWLVAMFGFLLLVTYWPAMSLTLPRLLGLM
jgi:C4-dicarboxylate transporter DctM subunit